MRRIYLLADKLVVITTILVLSFFWVGNVFAEDSLAQSDAPAPAAPAVAPAPTPEVAAEQAAAALYEDNYAAGGVSGSIIPKCALEDRLSPRSPCTNLTVFLALGVNASKYLFGIIGALALAAFVYGGFMLILSEGKQDKIKSGADAMLAAAIGVLVAFGGYVFIRFLGASLGVQDIYQLK